MFSNRIIQSAEDTTENDTKYRKTQRWKCFLQFERLYKRIIFFFSLSSLQLYTVTVKGSTKCATETVS